MADTVELMSGGLRVVLHAEWLSIVVVVSIQIAAWLLDCNNFANHGICRLAQLRLIARLWLKSNRFRPFVNIGVGNIQVPSAAEMTYP